MPFSASWVLVSEPHTSVFKGEFCLCVHTVKTFSHGHTLCLHGQGYSRRLGCNSMQSEIKLPKEESCQVANKLHDEGEGYS